VTHNVGFENKPKTGDAKESEETTNAEVPKEIKSKATSKCSLAIGTAEFTAEYREGEIVNVGGVETAKIKAAGNPAKTISRNVTQPAPANRIEIEGEVTEGSKVVTGSTGTTGILVGYEASSPGRARIAQCTGVAPECGKPVTVTKVEAVKKEVELSEAVVGSEAKKEKVKLVFEEHKALGGAVGINENHWYKNNVGLVAQSGAPGAEGLDTLSWGTLTLKGTEVGGELVCQHEAAGDIYNPEGSEWASISNLKGEAKLGKLKVDAWQAYDCEDTGAATKGTKCTLVSEGFGVSFSGEVAQFGEWEGGITAPGAATVTLGNTTAGSPAQMKFQLVCPENPVKKLGKLEAKIQGQQLPAFENGTGQGSAPAILTFSELPAPGSGKLEGNGKLEVGVAGKLKFMAFSEGQFINTKAP
jgi:hypothetical protein